MKRKRKKSIVLLNFIIILFITGFLVNKPKTKAQPTPFFTLRYRAYASNPYPDYANLIKQHLARIGIELEIILIDWGWWWDPWYDLRDYDITCLGFGGGGSDFFGLPNAAYRENSSLNIFGYDITMDFDDELGTGKNEWYIKQGNLIMPPESEERIQHAWDWQDYMQTEILPMKPFFATLDYEAYWNNLIGYNMTNGLRQSWGHMSWDGLHPGQENANEIVITDNPWSELNPFFYPDDHSGKRIIGYCLDNLIDIDADLSLWPMLAEGWAWIDDSTLDLFIRDNIKWPDYEDFTNEYLDVDDVYFTLYCWKEISRKYWDWFWLADFEKLDDMTIRLYIDGVPETPEPDPYAPALIDAATWIVPEHFLNQTQLPDGKTPDVTHFSWTDYSTNVWGTDIFEINSFTENVETILTTNEDSWHFDDTITSDPDLDYERRYGDYSGELDTLRIRYFFKQQASLLEFDAGKVDLLAVDRSYFDKMPLYAPTKDLQSDTTNFFNWIGFNMRESRDYIGSREPCPLDSDMTIGLAIRKAISYAIDRSEINQIIHDNENVIWDYPNYPSLGIWNNPNIIRYNFDLDKAKEYMTKAGFDLGWTETIGFSFPSTITFLAVGFVVILYIIKRKKIQEVMVIKK